MKCEHPNAKYFRVCPLILFDEVDEQHKFPDDCTTCDHFRLSDKRIFEPLVILTCKDDEACSQQPIIFNTEKEAADYVVKKYDLLDDEAHAIFETGYALIEPGLPVPGKETWKLSDMSAQTVKPWFEYEITSSFDDQRNSPPTKLEINFDDLSLETQGLLLKLYGIDTPNAANWNVFPVFVAEAPDEVEETETEKKTESKTPERCDPPRSGIG